MSISILRSLGSLRLRCPIRKLAPPKRALRLSGFFALVLAALSPLTIHAQLSDDFTTDESLNTSLWTSSSGLLRGLATEFNSTLVIPTLSFSGGGMNLSGVNGQNKLAGVQSLNWFQPPFTVTTTVTASEAHGNAFELYLVNADLTQGMDVAGNVNPDNDPYYGIWVNYGYGGQPFHSYYRGNKIYSNPNINSQYTIQVFMESTGTATVSLFSSSGALIGQQAGLYIGTGPFYLILGQREGGPNVLGPNIATWENVTVTALAPTPVLAPITWNNGTVTLAWGAVAGATYQVQYTTNLSPAEWNNLGPPVTANTSVVTVTDYPPDPQRFYRVVLMP